MAAPFDVYLRTVPPDADPDDVRLRDPTTADAGGGSPVTVIPDVGAIVVVGLVPTVLAPRLVIPGVATAIVLTGLAPTVLAPRLVVPGVGAVVLTGLAPTVLAPRLVVPGVGSIVLAGLAPTVLTPQLVVPGVGSVALAGLVPDVIVTTGSAVVVIPGVGAIVITGLAPTVTTGAEMVATTYPTSLTLTAVVVADGRVVGRMHATGPTSTSVGAGSRREPIALPAGVFTALTPPTGAIAVVLRADGGSVLLKGITGDVGVRLSLALGVPVCIPLTASSSIGLLADEATSLEVLWL